MTMTPIIDVRELVIGTIDGTRTLIDKVDIRIMQGETVGLIGASGSGKTLIGRAIVGVLPANLRIVSGTVQIGYAQIESNSNRGSNQAQTTCTMVPQIASSALPPLVTAKKFVADAFCWNHIGNTHQSMSQADSFLEKVGLPRMSGAYGKRPHQLSGGMAQRVAIAAALATEPQLLFVDEPTSGLDPVTRRAILELLRALSADAGVSILLSTHDIDLVTRLCKRVIILQTGRVIAKGEPRQLALDSESSYVRGLLKILIPSSSSMNHIDET